MFGSKPRWLRIAFIVGAITDGVALLPMVFPSAARMLWGLDGMPAGFWFAMHYGAALMLGWTGLLVWAALRPQERRFVAALTALVLAGLMAAEAQAVNLGVVEAGRLIPVAVLQLALFVLFLVAYWRSSAEP
jgi:hypothetical protein